MARRYDNLAYDYQTSAIPAYKPYENPNIHIKKGTPKPAVRKKHKISPALKAVLLSLFAFSVLCRGVIITDKANQISETKKELAKIEAQNQEMQVEIEKALDLSRIEQLASDKLNMRRPEKYQICYINLDRVDYVEKAEGTSNAPIERAAKLFNNIKSYLD
ncbi:MAG: cell division protein FtsL [Clostridia bacterium]|nr:cell division protein FtsL [Clostridia bacterium]